MKTVRQLLAGGLAVFLFLGVWAQVQAQDAVTYTRIYTDAEGESHFEDRPIDLAPIELQGGEHALMAEYALAGSAMVLVLEPGAFEDWHPAPDPRLCVVIQGFAEVQVSDGELRTFGPGDLFILEDDHGRGHTTRTVGDESHAALMIPLSQVP